MTLVLLAITVLALVGTVRLSLQRARAARLARQELQMRWGMLSLQTSLLPHAEAMLQAGQAAELRPIVHVRQRIQLGGMRFELVWCDEQAKANANTLLARHGKENAERLLRDVLVDSPLSARVRLRPVVPSPQRLQDPLQLVGSYAQIVQTDDLQDLIEPSLRGDGVVERLTCWGDGRMNYRRAQERALRAVAGPSLDLGQIQQLLSLRSAEP